MAEHDSPGVMLVVWRNKGFLKMAHGSFGHIAVRLVGPPFANADSRSTYISWWPDADEAQPARHIGPVTSRTAFRVTARNYAADKSDELSARAQARLRAGAKARSGQRLVNPTAPPDQWTWVKTPDAKFLLPTRGQPGVTAGLDPYAIAHWWKVFNAAPSALWTTFGRNCAKVAAAALHAGGASEFVSTPTTLLWRPTVVEQWGLALRKRCHAMNEKNAWVTSFAHRSIPETIKWTKLWDLPTWKYQSDGGKLHPRSKAFQKIDALIPRYEPASKKTVFGARDESPARLLNDILDAIHEDLVANPNFNRKNTAALTLGKQCLDLLEHWATLPIEQGGTACFEVPPNLSAPEPVQVFEEFEEGVL